MNKIERGVLYGMSLGDGCINIGRGQTTYALTIGHGPKQEDYLKHKAEKLQSVLGGKQIKVSSYQSHNKTTDKIYTNLQLRVTNPYFNQIHRNLYPTGKKSFSLKVLNYLTDEGLAYWFMDDGSGVVCKSKTGTLCGCMVRISTYCSKEEALIIQSWFNDKYNLTCVFDIDNRSGRHSIRFGTQDSKRFCEIVKSFIIPSMRYKIDSVLGYAPRVRDTQPDTSEGEDIV